MAHHKELDIAVSMPSLTGMPPQGAADLEPGPVPAQVSMPSLTGMPPQVHLLHHLGPDDRVSMPSLTGMPPQVTA